MDILAIVRKESISVRRHLGLFLILLIFVPGMLVMGTAMYDQTVPEDIPVGIVPGEDATTEDDLSITRGGVAFFATPVSYEDPAVARDDLQREQVYLLIEVPGNITDAESAATFTVVSDQQFVPFQEPSNVTAELLDTQLDRSLPADIHVEHERLGDYRGLSEYLVPTGVLVFVVLFSLVYLPYQVRNERRVYDRLLTETRLEVVIATKVGFYGLLLAVPLGVFAIGSWVMGYDVTFLSPVMLAAVGLTYLLLSTLGLAIMFVGHLRQSGLFANLALAVLILATSSFVYPVGFFSSTRKLFARVLPTHYAVITTRSGMLRDVSLSLYVDYLAYLALSVLIVIALLKGSLLVYRRRNGR